MRVVRHSFARITLWLLVVSVPFVLCSCGMLSGQREAKELTAKQVQGASGARVAPQTAPSLLAAAERTYAVNEINDLQYYTGPDADPVKSKLDLYLPEGLTGFPVLFFIHGGAWTMGGKDQKVLFVGSYQNLGRAFASRGIGVAITNYRLSPKFKHPTHIHDVSAAWAWTHRNIARYGGRPDELFVMGHSAGGHLAALLTMDHQYLDALGVPPESIRGVIAMSGVYNVDMSRASSRSRRPPKMITDAFGTDPAVWAAASPINHAHPGLPPFLVITAERDPLVLRYQADQLAIALERNGVQTDFLILPGKNHFNEIGDLGSEGDAATQEIVRFIRSLLPAA